MGVRHDNQYRTPVKIEDAIKSRARMQRKTKLYWVFASSCLFIGLLFLPTGIKIGASDGKPFQDIYFWCAYYTPASMTARGIALPLMDRVFVILFHCMASLAAGGILVSTRLLVRVFSKLQAAKKRNQGENALMEPREN